VSPVVTEPTRGRWRGARDDATATITLVFDGHMDERTGLDSAAFLVRAVLPRPLAPTRWELVCDVRRIRSHDGAARMAWQRVLFPIRGSLSSITVVGGTALVRMAATAFGLFLGVPLHAVASDPRVETEA
jgi:hypothetical protein